MLLSESDQFIDQDVVLFLGVFWIELDEELDEKKQVETNLGHLARIDANIIKNNVEQI